MLAPFWTDVSTNADTHVWYHLYNRYDPDIDFLDTKVKEFLQNNFHDINQVVNFEPHTALKVTWENILPNPIITNSNATVQLILVSDGSITFTIFLYGNINWSPTLQQPIASSWQCSETGGYYNHPTSLHSTFPTVIGSSTNSRNPTALGTWLYRVDTCTSTHVNYPQLCYDWSITVAQQELNTLISYDNILTNCPCNLKQAQNDPQFYQEEGSNCFYTQYAPLVTTGARKCCYSSVTSSLLRNTADSGYLMLYHPLNNTFNNQEFDIQPFENCCTLGGLCSLFFEERRSSDCSNYIPPQLGLVAGDPHFKTLDGFDYTYNGIGEYTLLNAFDKKSGSKTFTLQTRTLQAQDKNGKLIAATIFGGLAALDVNSDGKFQVEMNNNRDGLIVLINNRDFTVDFRNNSNFRVQEDSIVVDKLSNNSVKALFTTSGIALVVSLKVKMLDNKIILPVKLKESSVFQGLLGNVNGNPEDDLELPDGTTLLSNLTESEIYSQYGDQWRTNETSTIFYYNPGFTNEYYQNTSFVPIFLDAFNSSDVADAEKICGLNNAGCVYDYLALDRDEAVANNTRNIQQAAEQEIITAANKIPTVTGTLRINATVNRSVNLSVVATDADNENVTIFFIGSINGQATSQQTASLTQTFTPDQLTNYDISYYAVDNNNGISSTETVTIYLCPGCNNGVCDYDAGVVNTTSQLFYTVPCKCDTGWTGNQCDIDVDGCANDPCPLLTTCNDKRPADQAKDKVLYSCSNCPTGYQMHNGKCTDIDECLNTTNPVCEQDCTNNIGGYTCSCQLGYRFIEEQCLDVNECVEVTSTCHQVCNNTLGSYSCGCREGYILQSDEASCESDPNINITLCNQANCEFGCTVENNVAECFCSIGYQLNSDNRTCNDINECTMSVAFCSQQCTNTDGSYICSCYTGFKIQEDKTSCKECSYLFWGPNCNNSCSDCSANTQSCDRIKGCVCKTGWSGAICTEDIDECNTADICGSLEDCQNSFGSYECVCKTGYEKAADGTCQDMNECLKGLDNCDKNADCINTVGSYLCNCNVGYSGNGQTCSDIDECALKTDRCQQECQNVVGSYNCQCRVGYTLNSDRKNCLAQKVDQCNDGGLICDTINGGCSINSTGDAYCFCNLGFEITVSGVNQTCTDIDECQNNNGGCQQTCTDNVGGYSCICDTGYKLSSDAVSCDSCNDTDYWGENCANKCDCGIGTDYCDRLTGCVCNQGYNGTYCTENINECLRSPSPCINNQKCVDTKGSYQCTCETGYHIQNETCVDMDECTLKTDACNQRCINKEGSYLCSCEDGFVLNGTTTCQNLDECQLLNNDCEQICADTMGSFYCTCKDGFTLNPDQFTCTQVSDPCQDLNVSCSYGCEQINSQPVCFCPQFYQLGADNQTCLIVYSSMMFTMTTDYPWISSLSEPTSEHFKHSRVDIAASLTGYYDQMAGFTSLTIHGFTSGSTVVQYTIVFNQNLTDGIIQEAANITDSIKQIIVLEKPYNLLGEKYVIYQNRPQEPVTCTLCGDGDTCVILSANSYECRPPLSEVEANSLFVEVTLQKTYNQNYGNKLHLDYAAFEDDVEKAFVKVMTGVDGIQYLNVTHFSQHQEGVIAKLVIIFNTVANKTGQFGDVLSNLLQIETGTRCVDIKDTCVSIYGSIKLGNTSTMLDYVICSTCKAVTEECTENNVTSRYQCVAKSTLEPTTTQTTAEVTTLTDTGSSDLILGLGLGIPLTITALIIAIIIICVCRRKSRSDTWSSDRARSDDPLNFTFGRYDPSLTGKTHRNPNETLDGAFGAQYMKRWSRTSATLDPYYREPPDNTMRPYVGPGQLDDFNLTDAQSSDPNDLGFDTTFGEDDFGERPRLSTFSWGQIFDILGPREEFKIQRPQVDEDPIPIYKDESKRQSDV